MTDPEVIEASPAANKGTPGSAHEGSGDGGGRGSPSLPSEDAILKQVVSNLGITEEALKEKVLEYFDIELFADVAGLTDADVDSILTDESIGVDRKHRMRLVFLFRTLRTGSKGLVCDAQCHILTVPPVRGCHRSGPNSILTFHGRLAFCNKNIQIMHIFPLKQPHFICFLMVISCHRSPIQRAS